LPVDPNSWKAIAADLYGLPPVVRPVGGTTRRARNLPRAHASRPVLHSTAGAPRSAAEWNRRLSDISLSSSTATPVGNMKWDPNPLGRPKPKPSQAADEGYSIMGFLGNVAGEVKDISLGLVGLAATAAKAAGTGVYGHTVGLIPGIGGDMAREEYYKTQNELADGAWQTVKQSANNWKSALSGNFRPLYEHPVSMALDVAAVASLGAGGVAKGAQLGRASSLGKIAGITGDAAVVAGSSGIRLGKTAAVKTKPVTRTNPYPAPKGKQTGRVEQGTPRNAPVRPAWLNPEVVAAGGRAENLGKLNARVNRLGKFADSRKLSSRLRPDRILEPLHPLVLKGLDAVALEAGKVPEARAVASRSAIVAAVRIPQRPLARGPIARQIQKGALKSWEIALGKSERLNNLSEKRLAGKVVNKADRIAKERSTQIQIDAGRLQFDRALRGLGKDSMARAATSLHLEGVITPRSGKTASELRDTAVLQMEKGLAAERKAHPHAHPDSFVPLAKQIQLVKDIPDHMLRLEGDHSSVAKIQRAVDAGRRFDQGMHRFDPYNLDKSSGIRDVRGERSTVAQRVLLGGAKDVALHAPGTKGPSRLMVPERFRELTAKGAIYASDKSVAERVVAAESEVRLTGKVVGNRARTFLRGTDEIRQRKDKIKPSEAIALLDQIQHGSFKVDGRVRFADEATKKDAKAAAGQIVNSQKLSGPVTAWRVRGADGGSTQWVRETVKGKVPEEILALHKTRKKGDIREAIVVPADHWRAKQGEDGRAQSLSRTLENGKVRLPDGTVVGRKGKSARPVAGAVADVARYKLSESELPPRLGKPLGSKPGGFSRSLQGPVATLVPDAEAKLRRKLGFDKPRDLLTAEEAVIRRLVKGGHLDLANIPASIAPMGMRVRVVEKAIAQYTEKLFEGRLPLDASGQVNFTEMFKRLYTDPVLRDIYNDPKLTSNVPVEPSVFMSHRAIGTVGEHGKNKNKAQASSPLAPEAGTRVNTGALAGRAGYSLDPSVMLYDANNISRIVASRDFLHTAVSTWALSTRNGEPVLMNADDALRQVDPKKYMIFRVEDVNRAEKFLADGEPNSGQVFKTLEEVTEGSPDQVMIFPKDIGKKIQYSFSTPGWWEKYYDTPMHLWRAGVLALTPRWYLNNLVGNTFFYGVYTGMDLTSIRLAAKARTLAKENGGGSAVPNRISGGGITSQADNNPITAGLQVRERRRVEGIGRKGTEAYKNVTDSGYLLNSKFEGAIRDAAYVHAFRKFQKDQGVSYRTKGNSRAENDAEMLDAMANAPDHIKQLVIEETERWMGDYRGLNKFERDVVRRAVPFYSWIRVINTWLFGMPFRSPLRAQALSIAGQIGRELQGDRSYLPWWEQGRIQFGGDTGWALRTGGLNPMSTVIEELIPLGKPGAGPLEAIQSVALSLGGSAAPPVQALVGALTGRKLFGDRGYTAAPGDSGTVGGFGKEPRYLNRVTGQIETESNKTDAFAEGIFQMVPFAQQFRDVMSNGKTPYDSSNTAELFLDRLTGSNNPELYQPPKQESGRRKLPAGLQVALGLAGMPGSLYDVRREKEVQRVAKAKLFRDNAAQNAKIARLKIIRAADTPPLKYNQGPKSG